jgi:hypothetical protein
MNAKDRLAEALIEAGATDIMVNDARRGRYADFESESATPISDLVRDCRLYGLDNVAIRAINGDFDGE